MGFLSASLVILAAISQNVFYIKLPINSVEQFVCFSNNSNGNDSWPSAWYRLNEKLVNDNKLIVHSSSIPFMDSNVYYKIRMVFQDRSYGQTKNWMKIYNPQSNKQKEIKQQTIEQQQTTENPQIEHQKICNNNSTRFDILILFILICIIISIQTTFFVTLFKCMNK